MSKSWDARVGPVACAPYYVVGPKWYQLTVQTQKSRGASPNRRLSVRFLLLWTRDVRANGKIFGPVVEKRPVALHVPGQGSWSARGTENRSVEPQMEKIFSVG